MKSNPVLSSLATLFLRGALVAALLFSGWLIYTRLPDVPDEQIRVSPNETTVQLALRPSGGETADLDIQVELYPVDVVAVRHEYFTERRAGKRFDDFLSERMQGRSPIRTRLDKQGHASVAVRPGNWWVHALLSGEEELEWRLPVNVSGRKQIVELTPHNVYTRTRSF
ncbi:MAG TPA: hypothetical protein VGW36_06755 [Pyrinomonadaceae bacterium]|nr:hypothetical protein [Pyrinomonadaceae bacterium]